jgi:signal recognition particle subunit SRP72
MSIELALLYCVRTLQLTWSVVGVGDKQRGNICCVTQDCILSRVDMAPTTSKKRTQKKPVPEAERVQRLFSSLCAQIDGGHFANAIRTCDKSRLLFLLSSQSAYLCLVLKIHPADTDALSTKLFLLLQTDQHGAALGVIDASSELAFERAYALYRSHEDAEAQRVVKSLKELNAHDRGLAHLDAQLVRDIHRHAAQR